MTHFRLLCAALLAAAMALNTFADDAKVAQQRRHADQLFAAAKTEEAKAMYQRLASHFANDFEFNKRLAYCFFVSPEKEMHEAARYYAIAHRLNPGDREVETNLGKTYSWSKQYGAAIQVFQRILAREPSNIGILLELARAQSYDRRIEEASASYQAYLRRSLADRTTRLEYAAFLSWNKQLDAALREYRAVLGADPANIQAALGEAQMLAWQGKHQEALDHYDGVLKRQPRNYDALRGKAFVLLWQQRHDDAAVLFDQASRQNPSDTEVQDAMRQIARWRAEAPARAARDESDALRRQIDAAMARNDLPGAAELLRKAIARAPDPAMHLMLARVLSWSGKLDEASGLYQQLLQAEPTNTDATLGLAQTTSWQGQTQRALELFDALLRRLPDSRDALLGKAQALHWSGQSDKAVALLEPLREKWPQDVEVASTLQAVRDAEKERAEQLARAPESVPRTIAYYQQLLETEPTKHEHRLELARRLSWSGRNAESIQQYREFLRQKPTNVEARLGLARVLSWDRQLESSLAEYAAVLKADPTNHEAQIERARVFSWKGDTATALHLYDEILFRQPEDRDARLGKAQVLYWSGRAREAKDILESLRQNDPDVMLAMAGVHSALGRRDLALRQLDDLDKLQPGQGDAQALRRSINADLRPTLTLAFTPSVDSFDLAIYAATATLQFSLAPQVRNYVMTGVFPADDPVFGSATGREILFGSSGRVTDWLQLRGEAGGNTAVRGRSGAIGGGGATFFVNDRMQFDIDISRRYVNYIPRPITLNISRDQFRAAWDWRPQRRTSFHVDYYHQRYSDTNTNHGANFTLLRHVVRNDRLQFETGYLYSVFGFTRQINSGFFAPERFQRHAALGNVRAMIDKRSAVLFWGSLGGEQIHRDPFRLDGTARGAWEFSPAAFFRFSVGGGYFAISSIARAGAYTTLTGYLTLEFRF